MSRLYFIFVLILMFTFQLVSGHERSVEGVYDKVEEKVEANKICIGTDNYCCNYAAVKSYSHPEENFEELVSHSKSSAGKFFFGPVLIIISLLVLRTLSKRAEE